MTTNSEIRAGSNMGGVFRAAATGATVMTFIFGLCWLGANLGFNGVHTYIALFTAAPVWSVTALLTGLCISVVLGGLIGAATAASYRAFAFLSPR